MDAGATEVLGVDILARDGLDDLRAGEKHIAGLLLHEDEVGEGRRIDRATGAGAEDGGDLGNDARGKDVALEDLAIARQGGDALLDACATRIVHTDHRRAVGHRHVHHLADLLRHRLGERAAIDGEVLGIDIDQTAVYRGTAGYDAVAQELLLLHAEVVATMEFEHVILLERVLIDQHLDALTRCVLAARVLLLDGLLTTAEASLGTLFHQCLNLFCLLTHISYILYISVFIILDS